MRILLTAVLSASILAGLMPVRSVAEDAVAKGDNVNVRARPTTSSEIITRLKKGEMVDIVEVITVKKPKKDEPSKWARIVYPTNTPVWVNSQFIDPTNKSVAVKKLNLRAGPGENYSVLGTLGQGTPVTPISEKEGWAEIETPTNAFAYVALDLLATGAVAPLPPPMDNVTNAPPVKTIIQPPPVENPVIPTQPPPETVTNFVSNPPPAVTNIVSQPPPVATNYVTQSPIVTDVTNTRAASSRVASTARTNYYDASSLTNQGTTVVRKQRAAQAMNTNQVYTSVRKVATPPPIATTAPTETIFATTTPVLTQKRVVVREGIVRRAYSPKAPTAYELENPDTGLTMDYLFSINTEIQLKKYIGYRVIVTGQEGVDAEWPETPVLQVETIEFP